jgi:hypothetical protein
LGSRRHDLGQSATYAAPIEVTVATTVLGEAAHHHRRHERLRGLRYTGQQVAHEVSPATLPRGTRQHRRDRLTQSGVGVARDQRDAGEAAGDQAAEEAEPGRPVLLGAGR